MAGSRRRVRCYDLCAGNSYRPDGVNPPLAHHALVGNAVRHHDCAIRRGVDFLHYYSAHRYWNLVYTLPDWCSSHADSNSLFAG